MTTTATASLTTTATVEERRAALLELADLVDTEDRNPNHAPLSPVLRLIVPSLCSHLVARDVDLACNLFGQLVAASGEFARYCSNERDWLHAHDLPDTDRQREETFEHLRSDIDCWVDRLLARTVAA